MYRLQSSILLEINDKTSAKTTLGKWSIGLIIAFFLLLATGIFVVTVLGQTGGNTIFDNPSISVPMLGAGASAIAAAFTGIVSVWRQKERAILVFVPIIIGFLVLWFVLGEILVPH